MKLCIFSFWCVTFSPFSSWFFRAQLRTFHQYQIQMRLYVSCKVYTASPKHTCYGPESFDGMKTSVFELNCECQTVEHVLGRGCLYADRQFYYRLEWRGGVYCCCWCWQFCLMYFDSCLRTLRHFRYLFCYWKFYQWYWRL